MPLKFGLKFSILTLLCVALLYTDINLKWLQGIRQTLLIPLTPFHALPTKAHNLSNWIQSLGLFQSALLEKNEQLETYNQILLSRLHKLVSLEQENDALRELLGVTDRIGSVRLLVAETQSVSFNPFDSNILIDRGTDDGVYLHQPVVEHNGIIGQVSQVNENQSIVTLINSISHATPITNQRNGARGILFGNGENLELRFIFQENQFRTNDILITSGLGNVFPAGYPVAVVKEVKKKTNNFTSIVAKPLASLNTARYVLLLWDDQE